MGTTLREPPGLPTTALYASILRVWRTMALSPCFREISAPRLSWVRPC